MPTANSILTAQARAALRGQWIPAAILSVVYAGITVVLSLIPILGWVLSILTVGPLVVGYKKYFLRLLRQERVEFNQLFDGFSCFAPAFVASILCTVFIFLWTLLLVVPGIIAAISYSMTFFIIADNPQIDGLQAIRRSKQMMRGHKFKLFCLGCRFIGWFLLGVITLGIGFFFVGPYWTTAHAAFYQDLLAEPARRAAEQSRAAGPIIIP